MGERRCKAGSIWPISTEHGWASRGTSGPVQRIIEKVKIPVDLGGGIRSLDTAKKVLDLGVDRIVVGTTAALDNDLAKGDIRQHRGASDPQRGQPQRLRCGARLAARTDELAEVFAKRMVDMGARRIVFTDVSRKRDARGRQHSSYEAHG